MRKPAFKMMLLIFLLAFLFVKAGNTDENFTKKLMMQVERIHRSNSLFKENKSSRGCLTLILHEARRNWDILTEEGKTFFKAMWGRPSGFDETYSTQSGYFLIHYTVTGEDAVSATDSNENDIPDYIEGMGEILDKVYEMNVNENFMLPPPDNGEGSDDNFDIYVSNSEAGDGVYGYTEGEDYAGSNGEGDNPNSVDVTEVDSWYSFMVLRSNYEGFGETDEEQLNALKVTCAHEFAHAVQFGYGTYIYPENGDEIESMDGFMMEGCATWSEDWIYPGIDDNFQYLGQFFNSPDFVLNWNNEEEGGIYEDYYDRWYSTWIFFRYLSEMDSHGTFSSEIIRNLYQRTVTETSLDAIDTELTKNYQTSLSAVIDDFYISCALLTNNESIVPYTFLRADDYREALKDVDMQSVAIEDTIVYEESEIAYISNTDGDGILMRLGCDYIKLNSAVNCKVAIIPGEILSAEDYSLILIKTDDLLNPTTSEIIEGTITQAGKIIELVNTEGFNDNLLLIVNHSVEPPLNNLRYSISVFPVQAVDLVHESDIPSEVKLYQNYPNPFNPSTTISFSLPERMHVRLEIIDATGALVNTLLNDYCESGYHHTVLNADDLASGIYFAVLKTGNKIMINKLVLIK